MDHQAQEPDPEKVREQVKQNTDDREVKRVRFTESRGQKRQGEDVEELAAKAEEQHLDADVEVPAHKTWRVEDVVAEAADAAHEQMNSFVQSKTEVFEKRLKSHSEHCAWSKSSMMMRSWSCACSQMS